ncbi:hypothetical protein CGZ93_17910 [Enemella dayhoffiae]|uniref:Rho termination factor N-terminal domain-containing protein n=1 Tax=Enemella dayhoffiae TaxID=2016507 RepID=A0A255GPY9_9ACTN|nr:hypothetical protein [Enemella dayhoffiae]OYO16636.1 hypothetical protein CGZ93_17910 [Enemella dayhoffiae]
MRTFQHVKGDVIHVEGPVADYYAAHPEWAEVDSAEVEAGETSWEDFTVAQLKEYAADSGIDLGGASTKAAIIAKIEEN